EPPDEIDEILARRIAFRLLQGFPRDRPLPGQVRRRQGRQAGCKGKRLVVALGDPAEIEHGRDEDEAAEADALVALELAGEKRPPEPAIALAGKEFRRLEPALLLEPAGDEGREPIDI